MTKEETAQREGSNMALFDFTKPISAYDFDRYISGIGLKAVCVECGMNTWSFVGLDGQQVPSFVVLGPTTHRLNVLGETIPCIILNCSHCGYMRVFNRNVVANWVHTHPA